MWSYDVSTYVDPRYELTMDEFYHHYTTLRKLASLPLNQVIYLQATLCLRRCETLYHRLMHFANTTEQKQAAYKAYQSCIKQCGWRAY